MRRDDGEVVAAGGDGDLQRAATHVRPGRQRGGWVVVGVADLHRRQPREEGVELHRGLQRQAAEERHPDATPVRVGGELPVGGAGGPAAPAMPRAPRAGRLPAGRPRRVAGRRPPRRGRRAWRRTPRGSVARLGCPPRTGSARSNSATETPPPQRSTLRPPRRAPTEGVACACRADRDQAPDVASRRHAHGVVLAHAWRSATTCGTSTLGAGEHRAASARSSFGGDGHARSRATRWTTRWIASLASTGSYHSVPGRSGRAVSAVSLRP